MRYFFNQSDRLDIEDKLGRDFELASDAIGYARQLAADIRCLETTLRPALAIDVVTESAGRIHREMVFDGPQMSYVYERREREAHE